MVLLLFGVVSEEDGMAGVGSEPVVVHGAFFVVIAGLMPLSYAATLGGSCTLIGNSSNLVIASLYAKQTGTSMHMSTPFLPGLFCTVIGIITIILLRNRIPKRESPGQSFESIQDFTVELLVPTENEFIGKTVGEAGLRYVRGGLLIEIVRSDGEIKCCQANGVTKYIDWDLLLILGTTVIFSTAITKTGILASLVSEFFSDVGVAEWNKLKLQHYHFFLISTDSNGNPDFSGYLYFEEAERAYFDLDRIIQTGQKHQKLSSRQDRMGQQHPTWSRCPEEHLPEHA